MSLSGLLAAVLLSSRRCWWANKQLRVEAKTVNRDGDASGCLVPQNLASVSAWRASRCHTVGSKHAAAGSVSMPRPLKGLRLKNVMIYLSRNSGIKWCHPRLLFIIAEQDSHFTSCTETEATLTRKQLWLVALFKSTTGFTGPAGHYFDIILRQTWHHDREVSVKKRFF